MVKVIYREYGQQADLAGKSVAEVRELYKSEFSIPDQAKASLNGKQLNRKLEPETKLGDEDKLSFEEKGGRGLVLFGALLLALAVTGGLFAYTYTSTSTTITVTLGSSDYADISANSTPDYTILGRTRGTIAAATLFNVDKNTSYSGDLEVNVYLSNVDELTKDYSFWMMRLELQDVGGSKVDIETITQVLSLDNPMVSFACDNWTAFDRYIKVLGGSYRAFHLPG